MSHGHHEHHGGHDHAGHSHHADTALASVFLSSAQDASPWLALGLLSSVLLMRWGPPVATLRNYWCLQQEFPAMAALLGVAAGITATQ